MFYNVIDHSGFTLRSAIALFSPALAVRVARKIVVWYFKGFGVRFPAGAQRFKVIPTARRDDTPVVLLAVAAMATDKHCINKNHP